MPRATGPWIIKTFVTQSSVQFRERPWFGEVQTCLNFPKSSRPQHIIGSYRFSTGAGGEKALGLIFAGYMPLASQSPYLIIVYSVVNYNMYRPYLSHFWANIKFSRSQLSHFLFMYLPYIEWRLSEELFTFHLQYKHSGAFANRKYEELSYPKKSENVRPHSSNSIENATPL